MKMSSFTNMIKTILGIGAMATLTLACTHSNTSENGREDVQMGNGIYYWKTTFDLSENESEFLKKHDIKRLYLKLFDVDVAEDFDGTTCAIPVATTQFEDSIPANIEIVPVVYITQAAIHNYPAMDSLLYERIRAMGKRNGFDNMKEIQLDCDWTSKSRPLFFHLCQQMGKRAHSDSIAISATIRLHQLRDSVPPVDRGVLMVYNTGSLYDPLTQNSILDDKDVEPYLQSDIHYPIPLSVAYPAYGWGILLQDNEFQSILHSTTYDDTTKFKKINTGRYAAKEWTYFEDQYLQPYNEIRVEHAEPHEIEAVKEMLRKRLHPTPQNHILYHLDEGQLSYYTDEEIEKILK